MDTSFLMQAVVGELMRSDVRCVSVTTRVEELISILLDRGISAVPVVDTLTRPVGILTKTDLIRHRFPPPGDMQAGELMTRVVYSLTAGTPLAEAVAAMGFEGIHHLPVINGAGRVIGILSSLDLLEWIARRSGYVAKRGEDGLVFARP